MLRQLTLMDSAIRTSAADGVRGHRLRTVLASAKMRSGLPLPMGSLGGARCLI